MLSDQGLQVIQDLPRGYPDGGRPILLSLLKSPREIAKTCSPDNFFPFQGADSLNRSDCFCRSSGSAHRLRAAAACLARVSADFFMGMKTLASGNCSRYSSVDIP